MGEWSPNITVGEILDSEIMLRRSPDVDGDESSSSPVLSSTSRLFAKDFASDPEHDVFRTIILQQEGNRRASQEVRAVRARAGCGLYILSLGCTFFIGLYIFHLTCGCLLQNVDVENAAEWSSTDDEDT